MKKKLTLLALLIISCFTLSAQVSPFLNKGESGLGLYAAYNEGYDYVGYHGILSYSFGAKFDVSLCLSQSFYNKWTEGLLNLEAESVYYSGQFTWWMFKEELSSKIEVNVGSHIGFEGSKYSKYVYTGGEYDGYFGGYLGLDCNVNFFLPKKIIFQPHFIINKGFGVDQYITSGIEDNRDYYGTSTTLGVTLGKKAKDKSVIYITLDQSSSNFDHSNAYYFGAGYVIPF